jgi:hypothetical protein
MLSYGEARALAKMNNPDWGGQEYIESADITYVAGNYMYDFTVYNTERMDDDEFKDYITVDSEDLAMEDAEERGLNYESIDSISFNTGYISADELFDEGYEDACEFEADSIRNGDYD